MFGSMFGITNPNSFFYFLTLFNLNKTALDKNLKHLGPVSSNQNRKNLINI